MKKNSVISLLLILQTAMFAQNYNFYALSNDNKTSSPLFFCSFNSVTGAMSLTESYGGVVKSFYMGLSPDNKHLLVTSRDAAQVNGGLVQFNIAEDGKLVHVQDQFKTGNFPSYVSFTPDMQYALSSNYFDEEISLYNFTAKTISAEIDHVVKPNDSKGHYISTDPSGKFVHAVFLGLDKVFNYVIEEGKLIENSNQASFSVPDGYGPRHMAFHPNNNFVYILHETHSSITTCSYNSLTGELTEMNNISLLPADYTGTNAGAAIRVHPSGKFLYASNRGYNSVVAYQVAENGHLTLLEHETVGMDTPQDLNLIAGGKFMLVANRIGNSILSLAIDEDTGELTSTGESLTLPKPVSIVVPTTEENSTGINTFNNVKTEDLVVYPNPSKDKLQLILSDKNKVSNIELYTLSGQLVKSYSQNNIDYIDVSDLSSDSYLLVVNTVSRQLSQVIVIQ